MLLLYFSTASIACRLTYGPVKALRPTYMHVPKCGSVFVTQIIQTHCPEMQLTKPVLEPTVFLKKHQWCVDRFRRIESGHHGACWGNCGLVTMLRDPRERFISAFLDNLHSCTDPSIEVVRKEANYESLVLNRTFVAHYADCAQGTSVKMLNGHSSHNRHVSTPTEIERAKVVLARAAFVGIHEQWNESVCLYQARFGGISSAVMTMQKRPSRHPYLKDALNQTLSDIGWGDPAEYEIYQLALRRFNLELLAHAYGR